MNITRSFKTCVIEKYSDFKGRATRSEYWWFWLSYVLLSLVTSVLTVIVGDLNLSIWSGILIGLYCFLIVFGLMCPFIAVSVRRLHDSGLSGWHFLWRFIPVIGFPINIYLMTRGSKSEILYNDHTPTEAILSTKSINKRIKNSPLKKISITLLIVGLGIFGSLSIYYIPYFIIICTYYVYLTWTKKPLKVNDYLMLPLLRKIGLYKSSIEDYIIKKKLITFSVIMVWTLLIAFTSAILIDLDDFGNFYLEEDYFNIAIINIIVLGLFVFSLITWILFFFYEYMTQYILKENGEG